MKWLAGVALLLVPRSIDAWTSTSSGGIIVPRSTKNNLLLETDNDSNTSTLPSTHLVFPGGGIFFYWQAGAITYLREKGYDLSSVSAAGASAGALTATLTASNVDFYDATKLALKMSEEASVWDRRGGLQGIWGPIIHDWLDELLPDDVVDRVSGKVRTRVLMMHVNFVIDCRLTV